VRLTNLLVAPSLEQQSDLNILLETFSESFLFVYVLHLDVIDFKATLQETNDLLFRNCKVGIRLAESFNYDLMVWR